MNPWQWFCVCMMLLTLAAIGTATYKVTQEIETHSGQILQGQKDTRNYCKEIFTHGRRLP